MYIVRLETIIINMKVMIKMVIEGNKKVIMEGLLCLKVYYTSVRGRMKVKVWYKREKSGGEGVGDRSSLGVLFRSDCIMLTALHNP